MEKVIVQLKEEKDSSLFTCYHCNCQELQKDQNGQLILVAPRDNSKPSNEPHALCKDCRHPYPLFMVR